MTIIPNLTLVFQIVLFLVLMVILDKVLFKPMLKVLDERKARTEGRRKSAEEAETKAETIWEAYQTKVADARTEADKARAVLVKQGEEERTTITAAATAEADKTVSKVKAKVATEAAAAQDVLKGQIDALASEMAEKILGRAV